MAERANPWLRDYGVVTIVAVALASGIVGIYGSLASINTRLAVLESRVMALSEKKIPPAEQVSHNEKNDEEIAELESDISQLEHRMEVVLNRFHSVMPELMVLLRKLLAEPSEMRRQQALPPYDAPSLP